MIAGSELVSELGKYWLMKRVSFGIGYIVLCLVNREAGWMDGVWCHFHTGVTPELDYMGETEALFRPQEISGPLFFGLVTRIILFYNYIEMFGKYLQYP